MECSNKLSARLVVQHLYGIPEISAVRLMSWLSRCVCLSMSSLLWIPISEFSDATLTEPCHAVERVDY